MPAAGELQGGATAGITTINVIYPQMSYAVPWLMAFAKPSHWVCLGDVATESCTFAASVMDVSVRLHAWTG